MQLGMTCNRQNCMIKVNPNPQGKIRDWQRDLITINLISTWLRHLITINLTFRGGWLSSDIAVKWPFFSLIGMQLGMMCNKVSYNGETQHQGNHIVVLIATTKMCWLTGCRTKFFSSGLSGLFFFFILILGWLLSDVVAKDAFCFTSSVLGTDHCSLAGVAVQKHSRKACCAHSAQQAIARGWMLLLLEHPGVSNEMPK